MQWFNSPRYRLGIILGVLFFSSYCVVLAEDIEIDLGTTPTPAVKSRPTVAMEETKKTNLSPIVAATPETKQNPTPLTSSASRSSIDSINVSAVAGGTLVSLVGQNIPNPSIEKISNKKILIKFLKT